MNKNTIMAIKKVYIAIPLKAKKHSTDWSKVQANLIHTINSVRNSTDQRYEILVATNDPNDLSQVIKDNVTIIKANFNRPDHPWNIPSADKHKKRCLIASVLKKRIDQHYYIMFLDSDDLIHKNLIKYILNQQLETCFVMQYGYIHDTEKMFVYTTKLFPERSGSCFVGYYKKNELPDNENEQGHLMKKFKECRTPKTRKNSMYDMHIVPFKSMVYIVGHTEAISNDPERNAAKIKYFGKKQNIFQKLYKRIQNKSKRYMRKRRILKPDVAKDVLFNDFGFKIVG